MYPRITASSADHKGFPSFVLALAIARAGYGITIWLRSLRKVTSAAVKLRSCSIERSTSSLSPNSSKSVGPKERDISQLGKKCGSYLTRLWSFQKQAAGRVHRPSTRTRPRGWPLRCRRCLARRRRSRDRGTAHWSSGSHRSAPLYGRESPEWRGGAWISPICARWTRCRLCME